MGDKILDLQNLNEYQKDCIYRGSLAFMIEYNEKIQEVSSILPVLKSPTIVPLVEEGQSSLHSVIEEKRFWEVIDQLKKAGAEGILIIPIEKMIL